MIWQSVCMIALVRFVVDVSCLRWNQKVSPSPLCTLHLFLAPSSFGASLFHQRTLFFSLLHFRVASFFIDGLYFQAPCVLWLPFFIRGLYFLAPCVLGLLIFSLEVFVFEPLAFWGCLFFHQRSLFLSLLRFRVAYFFIRGLYFWAPCIIGLLLFSSEVFIFDLFVF
jgi:hypothetical protein